MDSLECDCAVVDDPQEVCPKHQEFLWRHVHDLEAKLSLAEKALEKVDIYFKALYDASPDCSRLCDEAGSAVGDALSQIKQIRWKGC